MRYTLTKPDLDGSHKGHYVE